MRVDKQISSILFVYPFLFEADAFEAHAEAIRSASVPFTESCHSLWQAKPFPEDDLLEHVRRYLNPPAGTPATALLWQMEPHAMEAWLCGCTGHRASRWMLHIRQRAPIEFQICAIHLAMFRVGVGFVIIEARPVSDLLDDWLDFLHAFRFAYGQRGINVRLLPCESGSEPRGLPHIGRLIDELLTLMNLSPDEEKRQEREVFVPGQLIPFATLYIDGEAVSERQVGELLYRVRRFFHSERLIHPDDEELRLDHPSMLKYAKGMWFTFALEGGAFVAIDAPENEFFREELPQQLRTLYFLLFLITLYQRFALISLSQMVSERWLRGNQAERARAFEYIRNALLDFTARGYFSQVMQHENHHRVYLKWQETFELERLYREVSDEVREMHEYMRSEETQRLERRVSLLGAFVGAPTLVVSFLGINLHGVTAKEEGLPLWLALGISFVGGGLLGAFVLWLLNRSRYR